MYELGFYIPEEGNLYTERRETLRSYISDIFTFYLEIYNVGKSWSNRHTKLLAEVI
jgi:hypothetical protein